MSSQIPRNDLGERHHHATPFVQESRRLLEEIALEHGPVGLLGRLFLAATEAVADRGICLAFASFEDLVQANEQNSDSWGPLVPTFDCRHGPITPDSSFCILGYNAGGQVVCSQAARFYQLGRTSLKDALEDLSFLYPTSAPVPGQRCRITAPSAPSIRGRVVYSGGTWCRPDFRGRAIASLLPRISRCYALTKWDSDFTISFVTDALVKAGVARAYGYTNVEPAIKVTRGEFVDYEGTLVWMERRQLLSDAETFVSSHEAQIDGAVGLGRA